jgi:TolB protein
MNPTGTDQKRLTSGRRDLDPAWSPDGRRIAFWSYAPTQSSLYVMNADGSGLRRLPVPGIIVRQVWPPDGQRIAFIHKPDGLGNQLYVAKVDGSETKQLTSTGDSYSPPTWSPDSRRIAFASDLQIYVIDADGTNRTQLTITPANAFPAWSPGGRWIAFQSSRDNGTIWIMNPDGSDKKQLTPFSVSSWPVWSPDGRRIAFGAWVASEPVQTGSGTMQSWGAQIWVMNADGSGLKCLTRP